ncbi:MAG: sodium ion-translocating decarboxylase subunit beta [Candidatus Methylomirabilales bacterium]
MLDVTVTARLVEGFSNFGLGALIMMLIGGALIYLAIAKEYEPVLLLPIGAGCLLANIPVTGMTGAEGLFGILYDFGIRTEMFPLLIFIGVGAMTDFGPLLERPYTVILGAAAQFGIFGTLLMATLLGFNIREAASIGIIGSADGPTSIYVASILAPDLLAPIAVAAYSYMSLVPIIQPPIMRALITPAERAIVMPYTEKPVSKTAKVVFPIVTTLVCGLIAPMSAPLIGMLMFGNLLREAGVVERLSQAAQNELINVVTIFLGLTIGSTMSADKFLTARTIFVIAMGLVAFALDTVAGLGFGKMLSIATRGCPARAPRLRCGAWPERVEGPGPSVSRDPGEILLRLALAPPGHRPPHRLRADRGFRPDLAHGRGRLPR